jgi:hypothetical protein
VRSAGDANLDPEFRREKPSAGTDVAPASEPELSIVVKSGGDRFGDEPTGSSESCGDARRFVEVGTGVENLKDARLQRTQLTTSRSLTLRPVRTPLRWWRTFAQPWSPLTGRNAGDAAAEVHLAGNPEADLEQALRYVPGFRADYVVLHRVIRDTIRFQQPEVKLVPLAEDMTVNTGHHFDSRSSFSGERRAESFQRFQATNAFTDPATAATIAAVVRESWSTPKASIMSLSLVGTVSDTAPVDNESLQPGILVWRTYVYLWET